MLQNDLLTAVGALIGVSGSILSYIMVSSCFFLSCDESFTYSGKYYYVNYQCTAMNRSLPNVLFGGAPAPVAGAGQRKMEGVITKTNVEEVVDALTGAETVIIAPG